MNVRIACALLAFSFTSSALSADSTAFRGSSGDGISEAIHVPTSWNREENIAWEIALPGRSNGSPIVFQDKVFLTSADLERVAAGYDVVNIKLDKCGGLTEALRMLTAAPTLGLRAMVGCRLGTSLAMAPAQLVAQACEYVDLDAPLLIGRDREVALDFEGGRIAPPCVELWG